MIIPLPHLDESCHPALGDYTQLKDVQLRSALEPERGLYMAESTKVILRALEVHHRPRSFLMAPRWLEDLAPLIEQATGARDGGQVPIFIAEEPVLTQLTGFHLHRGALAAMERPVLPSPATLLRSAHKGGPARRVVILEDLVDHTNVGAVFRSAAALGVDAVFVTPSCADPLYRRSIRVSMGTVFQVPWTRLDRWPDPDTFHDAGFTLAALALSEDSIGLDAFVASSACTDPSARVALVMGTEGDGLAHTTLGACDTVVKIPMAGGVDSLNVAAASAVVFWATRGVGSSR